MSRCRSEYDPERQEEQSRYWQRRHRVLRLAAVSCVFCSQPARVSPAPAPVPGPAFSCGWDARHVSATISGRGDAPDLGQIAPPKTTTPCRLPLAANLKRWLNFGWRDALRTRPARRPWAQLGAERPRVGDLPFPLMSHATYLLSSHHATPSLPPQPLAIAAPFAHCALMNW